MRFFPNGGRIRNGCLDTMDPYLKAADDKCRCWLGLVAVWIGRVSIFEIPTEDNGNRSPRQRIEL